MRGRECNLFKLTPLVLVCVFYLFFETGSESVAQVSLELAVILLSQPPELRITGLLILLTSYNSLLHAFRQHHTQMGTGDWMTPFDLGVSMETK